MAFRISLNKAGKSQLGSKAKAEEDAKAREKNALDRVMAEFEEEHGGQSVLGESEKDHEPDRDVFVPTGAKRHFTGRPKSMKSGPGTLDAELGTGFLGPTGPSGLSGQLHPRFGGPVPRGPAPFESNREEENVYTTVVAKASNLPPSTDRSRVEELFSDFPSLKVTKVEQIPPSRPSSPSQRGRPSVSMKVIFHKDASARDLDDAMNKLNDKKYLGKGYYLHLDRYLGGRSVSTKQQEEQFGATLVDVEVSKGYAPPPNLGGANREQLREELGNKQLMVTANGPPDLATLRLIHQTIEGVILGGTEFEAALMEDPQVQEEERFAWLFDQKHPLNRYYRWRLHEIVTSTNRGEVFYRQPEWKGPEKPLIDEFASSLGDLDHEYPESDEDDEDKPARFTLPIGENYPSRVDTGYGIMSPRSRAMLIWRLATLPPSTAMAEEIAAFASFAVDHVTKGLDEVVHLLITNVLQPFYLTEANPKYHANPQDNEKDARKRGLIPQLTTNALRVLSDVALTTNNYHGKCYKYRVAIGSQLVQRQVFEYLERLPAMLLMGRMGETQYRDDINGILEVWKDEHLFEKSTLEHLDNAFNARKREKEQEELEKKLAQKRKQKKGAVPLRSEEAGSGEDGAKMEVDDDIPMGESDGFGDEPQQAESSDPQILPQSEPGEQDKDVSEPAEKPEEIPGETAAARARRLRPKAEDMFASDEE